jgi:pectate lyase
MNNIVNNSRHPAMKRRLGTALGALFVAICAIAILLSSALPAGSRAAGSTLVLNPVADAYVNNNRPNRNFGSTPELPADIDPTIQSFLRFDVAGIGTGSVSQARLRLKVSNASRKAELKIFSTAPDWDEATITWNRQPALGALVAQIAPVAMPLGSWVELDLGQAITRDGTYSFVMTTGSNDRFAFSSRTEVDSPQLVLALNADAALPSPTATVASTAAPASTAVPAPTAPPLPTAVPSGPALAFPGAEGFGAQTAGGRGGKILYVTTLADSGPGSLRSALESSGQRIVLFKVAGTITLNNDISIAQPYITIAGQTAPGEGVQIKGGMIKIKTHDVIIRYLKMRPGDQLNQSMITDRDALALAGNSSEVYNVIIDHSSMVWGPDIGGVSILTNAHDITIQNSILGEGLYLSNHTEATAAQNGHSLGVNITQLSTSAWPRRITLHHNLLTTADHRMPQVMGGEMIDIVNNVIYNWGTSAAHGNPRSLNLVNNVFIKGPLTKSLLAWEARTNPENPTLRPGSVYEGGNATEGFSTVRGDPQTVYATARFAPYSLSAEQSAQEAYNRVMQDVGANLPVRDSADQRIINNLKQRSGSFMNGSDLVWPALASGPVPADTDQDDLPDSWEQSQFGSLSDGTASNPDGDGYTNVEEYINGSNPKTADR